VIAGCGKTILRQVIVNWRVLLIVTIFYSSTIIQDVIDHCQSNPLFATAYFYFDFHDSAKQRHENLVRSLIEQFSNQSASTPDALENLYSRHQNGSRQPSADSLMSTLQDILQGFQQAYIVLDALDECSERDDLLSLIEEIVGWKLGTLHILATSRKEQEIEDCLSSLVSNQINIQSTVVDADIRIHVRDRLQKDRKLRKWSAEAQLEIEAALVDGAHGM